MAKSATVGEKRGPKLTPIDWGEFDKLCELHCTLEEIASFFDCSADTIERACVREHGLKFAEYFAQKAPAGRVSLRRLQFQAARAGDKTMLVWLGKQWLGQAEQTNVKVDAVITQRQAELRQLPTAELLRLTAAHLKGESELSAEPE